MVLLLLLFSFLPNNVVDDQKLESQLLDSVPDFFVDAAAWGQVISMFFNVK
jgi:hypothetical protein